MNGAECIIKAARNSGIEVCFANPGTTELPLAVALDTVGGIRPVLGLFEGVCTGAADGYARMLQKPAMVLLHLGPGLRQRTRESAQCQKSAQQDCYRGGRTFHLASRIRPAPGPWISSLWRRRFPDGSAPAILPSVSGRIWQTPSGPRKQGRLPPSSSRLISRRISSANSGGVIHY